MNKLAISLASGGVVVTGSAGVVYLAGGFGSPGPSPNRKFSSEITTENLDSFKKGRVGDCATFYFPGLKFENLGTDLVDVAVESSDFFKGTEASQPSSCFAVNWTKNKVSGNADKWRGEFKLTWSLVKGHKGFTMFSSVRSQTSDPEKFDMESGIYVVEKEGDVWSFKEKKEKSVANAVFSHGSDTSIPTNYVDFSSPGKALLDKNRLPYHWGFLNQEKQWVGGCDPAANCTTSSEGSLSFRRSWTWSPAQTTGPNEINVTDIIEQASPYFANRFGPGISKLAKPLEALKGVWKENSEHIV